MMIYSSMLLVKLFVSTLFICHSNGEKTSVSTAFNRSRLEGDLIPLAPDNIANVTFSNGHQAQLGNDLSPDEASYPPKVNWGGSTDNLYTLLMVDPDAPSPNNPSNRDWLHWMVVNIPGEMIGSGEQIQGYQGPAPPKGTGKHRYAELVYRQPGPIKVRGKVQRSKFNTTKFVDQFGLGDPVAGNFFMAQNF